MRPERSEWRERDHPELARERSQQRLLDVTQARERHKAWRDKSIALVLAHHVGRAQPPCPAPEHFEQQRRQIRTSEPVTEQFQQPLPASRTQDPSQRTARIVLSHRT